MHYIKNRIIFQGQIFYQKNNIITAASLLALVLILIGSIISNPLIIYAQKDGDDSGSSGGDGDSSSSSGGDGDSSSSSGGDGDSSSSSSSGSSSSSSGSGVAPPSKIR